MIINIFHHFESPGSPSPSVGVVNVHPIHKRFESYYTKYDVLCCVVLHVTKVTFWTTLLRNNEQILSRMMDESIQWPKPDLLQSTTCDVILSWMIESWMKNHLVCNNIYNIVNS